MRKLLMVTMAATIMTVPMATAVRAEDTTVIKRNDDGDKTIVKKRDELHVLPVPHVEDNKTIIKKEHDD